tara:strand:- start:1933 stop:2406 length:474 start_codon:yes stop_codon:yes gene_type:complete
MQQITRPQMTNDRIEATVFCGSLEDAKKIEERLTALFHESGRDFYVTTMNAEGTRPGDDIYQFRVDHTGRDTWISNPFENPIRYGPENKEIIRPCDVRLGDLVLRLFDKWHVCRVVSRGSGNFGIDINIVSITDPRKRESSYYPFKEDSTLQRISFR